MGKPRECWIHLTDCGDECKTDVEWSPIGHLMRAGCSDDVFHMIEKRAHDDLKEQADAMAKSLDGLKKEISGLMSAHRVVLGYDYGNSNCQAVAARVKIADEDLANYKKFLEEREGEHETTYKVP